MILRKLNAGLSLLTTVLLLAHAIFTSVWMLSGCTISKPVNFLPWILLGLMLIHVLISIDMVISSHMEGENRKGKVYPKMNVSMIVQRASGALLAPVTALHVAGAAGFMQPPEIVHAIVPPLFFTVALTHTAVSTGKAFITLGIGNAKFIKTVDIAMKVLCGATLIASVVGFYIYAFTGVA